MFASALRRSSMAAAAVAMVVVLGGLATTTSSASIGAANDSETVGRIEKFFTDIGGHKPVDLVLLMDRSHSMSKETFYLAQKKMAQAILTQYASLYTSYVRLAVITFAKDYDVVFDGISKPDSSPTKCALFADGGLWESVKYTQNETQLKGTNMKQAFIKAIEIFKAGEGNRPRAGRVLLVLSDGKYSADYDPINEAKELRETRQVTIYGVGLGSWLEVGNVRVVTSVYNNTYLFGKFKDWEKLIRTDSGTLTSYGPDTARKWSTCYTCQENTTANSRWYCDIDRGIESYLCVAGYYYNKTDNACIACPVNTYKPVASLDDHCTPCPPGTETTGMAKTVKAECQCSSCNISDPCDWTPCNERQTCVPLNETQATCECLDGWEGDNCTANPDACETHADECQHGSKCVDGLGTDVFTCVCTEWGYRGRYCEIDQDECTETMCVNNGTCEDEVNNFQCHCAGDWIGRYCQDVRTPAPDPAVTPQTTVGKTAPDNTLWIIIGACVGGGLFIVIVITATAVCIGHKRKQKNKQEVKSIAQQFSGFWKKRTLRGSKYIKEMEEDSHQGLPSAPPDHRPDLIESTTNLENLKTDEYTELPYQTMTLKTGMESWQSYISELEASKVIERALIVKLGGSKKAMTTAWMFDPDEVARLQELMERRDDDVPLLLQEAEYHVRENDGTMAAGRTIGSFQEDRVLAIGKTRVYLIIAVALANADNGKARKEVQWIVDHITGEGY